MPYVQVPKDLAKIKTKVAFNLTKRQLFPFEEFNRNSRADNRNSRHNRY